MDLRCPRHCPEGPAGRLQAVPRLRGQKIGADLLMKRRDFLAGALAMAVPRTKTKYRILDPHVHVWVNDPHYPWARETADPPRDDETPVMLLDLMKANGVARTVLVQ